MQSRSRQATIAGPGTVATVASADLWRGRAAAFRKAAQDDANR